MNAIRRKWSIIVVTGLIVLTISCIFPAAGAAPTATPQASDAPTPSSTLDPAQQTATAQFGAVETLASAAGTPQSGGGGASSGSGGGSGGSSGSGSGSGGGSGSGNSGGSGSGSSTATATEPPPSPSGGPYAVKQIETLGGEVLSGFVCKVTQPFNVTAAAPKVTFVFNFIPLDEQHGKVTYKYSISSAGESHDAAGTYTLSPLGSDGTLQLSLAVSDHVVFKGFDGNIPNRYKFNLVPAGTSPCP